MERVVHCWLLRRLLCSGMDNLSKVGPVLPTETDREVFLIPGNKPAPHSGCDGWLKNLPNGAIAFFLGSNGFYAPNDTQNNILTLDGGIIISMRRKEGGLLFSVEMFDTEDKLVAKINSNKSILIPKNYSYNERPDRSTNAVSETCNGNAPEGMRITAGHIKF
jgi:hypothetical protein